MLFVSSVGQTFFIGIFGPSIRTEFNLTHAMWGGVYMAGTIMSAMILPFTGKKIDSMPLSKYVSYVLIGLFVASIFMSVIPSITFLILAVFLLRHFGQGLCSHIGSTTMARYYPKNRGKAVAVASLGFSLAEAALPFLMILLIATVGWRYAYLTAASSILIIFLPLCLLLLKGHHVRHAEYKALQEADPVNNASSWSRGDMLSDYRFYLLLPAMIAPHFILTALFFHHLSFAELKGWDPTWFTASYWIYAMFSLITMLASGPLIDKFSAVKVLCTFLIPIILGLMLVWAFHNVWWAWVYLALIGITSGITYTGLTVFWAEVYGVKHLGAIKSTFGSLAVFASALGPMIMGVIMDWGVSIENICLIFALYAMVATVLLVVALQKMKFINLKKNNEY